MTSDEAAALVCAALEQISGSKPTDDGVAEVFVWCCGEARSGKSRKEMLATDEGVTLFRVMLRRLRKESADVMGIFRLRGGKWDSRGIQALTLAIDSNTRLCNGDT